VGAYWVRQCQNCRHQFAETAVDPGHVRRTYDDSYFTGGGAGYSDYLAERRLLIARGRWYAHRMAAYMPTGTMLDIGAAAGFTMRGFEEAGWQVAGVEPNGRMAEIARQQFGFEVHHASLESFSTEERFDLVAMLQVLPHLADPRQAVHRAATWLKPGGFLLIESWDRSSWTARLFGRRWHEYSPPSVLHWFSRDGVAQLVESAGFILVAQGRPSKWINAGHARSLLAHKLGSGLVGRGIIASTRILPDRLPIPYPAEDLFWAAFRTK
jgi:SAM-dependent methyltransferase